MSFLSKEETLSYIRDVLEVPISELPDFSDPSAGSESKKAFLETILPAHLEREPFQSIVLMSEEMKNRRRPSWDEIKRDIFSRHGGLCYWHNTFTYVLLESLGYDVTMSHSTVTGFSNDNHVVVLVHGLVTPGDLYLVDVGLGYYIPRPIPLDFAVESPVYSDSILTYKFKRESERNILLLKTVTEAAKSNPGGGSPNKNSVKQELKWETLYCFNPQERFRNLDEFFPCFDDCFTDITKLPFHTSPRAMRWSGGRFVGIVNSKLLEEIDAGHLTKTPITEDVHASRRDEEGNKTETDTEPLVQAYAKYFPHLPERIVRAALHNWKTTAQVISNPSHVTY